MERDQAREYLQAGAQLDGLVLNVDGLVVARGKVSWQGTTLSATREDQCTHLQLAHNGDRLKVPLVRPVRVRPGDPIQIDFGPAWQHRQQQRANRA